MRLLIVTGVFPPDIGGPARYVPAMAAALGRSHAIVGVVTLSDSAPDDAVFPFPVHRLPRRRWRPWRILRTIARLRALGSSAEIVYANGLLLECVIAFRFLRPRPLVAKIVGDLAWEKARNAAATDLPLDAFQRASLPLRWRALRALQAWYVRRCRRIIVPSRHFANVVAGWSVDPGRIAVVPNAVESSPEAAPAVPRYDLVTVARLVPFKGIEALIDVSGARDWTLLVVGDGPLRARLEAHASRAGAKVTFVGAVDRGRVDALLRSARVFVLNSDHEGLPHVVMEAKVAGLPVVATAVGGTPETIDDGENGLLVPPGDAVALAAAIDRLLRDHSLSARLVAAGRAQIARDFSFARMVSDTERVLLGACRT